MTGYRTDIQRKGVAGMDEEMVLCAASAYERKFYLNPEFNSLPEEVKQELQIMCVLYTADVGGILMVVYDENGNLELKVDHKEDDFTFDEIGSVLKIKQYQADLLDHIKSTCPDILTSIKTEKVMKPEIEEQLKKVLADFAKGYAA